MQEENKSTATNESKTEMKPEGTPSPVASGSTPASITPTEAKVAGAFIKELSTPIAIVIAGVFIGAGLYFSGGSTSEPAVVKTSGDPILEKALAVGVNEDDFTKCYQNGETLNLVQEDIDNAVATGGRGTPWSIIIGPGGKKYAINGALPQQSVEQMIELAKQEAKQTEADTEDKALNSIVPVTEADHIKGDISAPVKIVEYSDFECPFCVRFSGTMNSISAKYPGTEVAWVYRQFPLEQLHPQAKAISVASECVAKLAGNDAFWTFAEGYMQKF